MSLLNSRDEIAHGLIGPGGEAGAAGGKTTQFEMQAALIPDESKFEYESARKLARIVQKTFDSESADQYFLYFHGIVDRELDVIDRELRRVQLRTVVRMTFEDALDVAIIRITPGPEHAGVGICLYREIIAKIASIPGHSHQSVEGFGATGLQVPGVRSKEGDQGFGPKTRVGRSAWPSVMIEVGYSGGEEFLRLDAQWWLINSTGRIRFVILVSVTKNPLALDIECWSMAKPGGPKRTEAFVPTCVQNFNINSRGNVESSLKSTKLRIPYTDIFDQRQEGAKDVVLSFEELTKFALDRYLMMV